MRTLLFYLAVPLSMKNYIHPGSLPDLHSCISCNSLIRVSVFSTKHALNTKGYKDPLTTGED